MKKYIRKRKKNSKGRSRRKDAPQAVSGRLIFTPEAKRELFEYIGWLRNDYPDNRVEQGGLLIGYFNMEGDKIESGLVTKLLPAHSSKQSSTYLEWSELENIRMENEFFALKEEDPELRMIGWIHTHPNELGVFMSSIDRATQKAKCLGRERYAVVANPHKGIIRAWLGADCIEVPCILPESTDGTGSGDISHLA